MKKFYALLLTLIVFLSVLLTGCGYQYKELNLRANYDKSLQRTTLTVYNWGEYISDGSDGTIDVNKEFEKLTGIKVKYLTFESNETMYSQIKSGGISYDIIIPSDYMIERLKNENMLSKIDTSKLSNYDLIEDKYKNLFFDPNNEYSVPYNVGLVGIIYNEKLTGKEKKELSDEEKEYKSMRKQIQEKLIKFATRVPVFMYLTDYRERSLKDVITQLEPGLFKTVTGLDVKDFNLLVELNVFNASLMNDAIYKFKRYEDSSLSYTGIDKHEGEDVGGWDTVIKRAEYEKLFYNQQETMSAPERADDDVPEVAYNTNFEDDEDEPAITTVKSDVVVSNTTPPMPDFKAAVNFTSAQKVAPKQEEPEKPKVDVSGVKVGITVNHKKFGEGVVSELTDNYITVVFGKAEKKFMFPSSFENGFFTL